MSYLKSLQEAVQPFAKTVGRDILTKKPKTLQLNITRKCNLACKHCHVACSPARSEDMDMRTAERAMQILKEWDFTTLDITGGAPEMSSVYRYLIDTAASMDKKIMTRSNLTIFNECGYRDLPEFLKERKVEIVASLPFYEKVKTDKVRGIGVFHDSIEVLQRLCALGYGRDEELQLNLVYNPSGAMIPAGQDELEAIYRTKLKDEYDIDFNNLFSMTNSPIGRFGEWLDRSGNMDRYLTRLCDAFNPATVDELMCLDTLSVDYDGSVYDCDFNLALGMGIAGPHKTIFDIEKDDLIGRKIRTMNHCYTCTAGSGSS